jgi:divalent metal cation (Fe/Co/Zn/Cd) transporter
MIPDRAALVRRGLLLNYATLGYNALEAVVAIVAGVLAGSIALLGFGLDSVVEVASSVAAQWRLRADLDEVRRVRVEWIARRIIGWSFLALAAYVSYESILTLSERRVPDRSILGVAILLLSVIVMPWLARRKRQVAKELSSKALEAEAKQTSLCAYLSVIALAGVGLNTLLGWWWADPVAAMGMVPIITIEGLEGVRAARLAIAKVLR